MGGKIEVVGLRDLQRALRKVSADAPKELRKTNLEAARIVSDEAVRRVPVRTGRLRDSIRALAQQRGAAVRAGGARVPYAGPIHFGWPKRHIKPNPFLYEALDRRRQQVLDAYRKGVGHLIRQFD